MVPFIQKRLQVFVSSTYTDLLEERQDAVSAILTAGHIPAGMELFTAGDESQMDVIKQWIDESDVYLGDFQERPYPLASVKFRILVLPCGYNDC